MKKPFALGLIIPAKVPVTVVMAALLSVTIAACEPPSGEPPLDLWWLEIEKGGEIFGDLRYKSEDGGIKIIRYEGEGGTVTIPAEIEGIPVKTIGVHAFREKNLTEVIIPDSVILIEKAAFKDNGLTGVSIGNNVTSIGPMAFQNNQLTGVVIPDSVTSIGFDSFYSNRLTSVTIGKGVTLISAYAFFNNLLTSLIIPDSVTHIESHAFDHNQLTSVVVIPDRVKIDYAAFRGLGYGNEIIIGANVQFDIWAIDDVFYELYNGGGRQAGTYIRIKIPDATEYPGFYWVKQ